MRMPMWARRLLTRLLSVIPVLICVVLSSGQSTVKEHEALNNLMNNSQVFLAFALPFCMLPLLIMTSNEVEMGKRFKNPVWVKILGWISVIALTYLNLRNLPDSIAGFFGDNPTASELTLAHNIAYVLIVAIILLLIWTIVELYRGNKRYAQQLAQQDKK